MATASMTLNSPKRGFSVTSVPLNQFMATSTTLAPVAAPSAAAPVAAPSTVPLAPKWRSKDPLSGQWIDYDSVITAGLEDKFQKGRQRVKITFSGMEFEVDLTPGAFKQINPVTGTVREVERIAGPATPKATPTTSPTSGLTLPLQTTVVSNGAGGYTAASPTAATVGSSPTASLGSARLGFGTFAIGTGSASPNGMASRSMHRAYTTALDFKSPKDSMSPRSGTGRHRTMTTNSQGLGFFTSMGAPPVIDISSDAPLMLKGQPYKPAPRSVIVVGPGGGTRMNQPAYDGLRAAGWDLTIIHAPEYDRSPNHPDFLYPPGWETGKPDMSFNGGQNLASLADKVVIPQIEQLIQAGRGPAAIIFGSRGGQVTLPRVWALGWRGPVVCINGGCVKPAQIPGAPVRLILITGGGDFFETKDPGATKSLLKKEDARQPILLYHEPKDGHMPATFGDVVGPLLEIAVSQEAFSSMAANPCVLSQPQMQRHNVCLQVL